MDLQYSLLRCSECAQQRGGVHWRRVALGGRVVLGDRHAHHRVESITLIVRAKLSRERRVEVAVGVLPKTVSRPRGQSRERGSTGRGSQGGREARVQGLVSRLLAAGSRLGPVGGVRAGRQGAHTTQ